MYHLNLYYHTYSMREQFVWAVSVTVLPSLHLPPLLLLPYISMRCEYIVCLTFFCNHISKVFSEYGFDGHSIVHSFNIDMVSNSIFLFFDVGNSNKCGHNNLLWSYLSKSPFRFLNFPPETHRSKWCIQCALQRGTVYTFTACKSGRIYLAPIWA